MDQGNHLTVLKGSLMVISPCQISHLLYLRNRELLGTSKVHQMLVILLELTEIDK